MKTHNTHPAPGSSLAKYDTHTILLGIGAAFLTGAVLFFNGTYGYTFSAGMAAAFLGFAIVKDAGFAYAWAARGQRGRVAAGLLSVIAFGISCLAAIGAASHGRQEANDPKAAAISRYETAERQRKLADARLGELGKVATAAEADAKASAALAAVDKAIAKRTNGCSELAPASNGPRQVSTNREACQPYITAKAAIAVAREAETLRAKIEAADVILAEGRPASADAQASTLAALFGLFWAFKGIEGIQAWTNLFIGLGLEIGSPLAWAAFAAALRTGSTSPTTAEPLHVETAQTSFPSSTGGLTAADFIKSRNGSGSTSQLEPAPPRPPTGSGPKGGTRKARSEPQRRADLIARELRERGEVPKFHVVRSEYRARFGTELPKVTAHRAVS